MREIENKARLRNFRLKQEADEALLRLRDETGKDMTDVIEDLLLGKRQFRPDLEAFIVVEMLRTQTSRNDVIEAALKHYADSRLHYPSPNPAVAIASESRDVTRRAVKVMKTPQKGGA